MEGRTKKNRPTQLENRLVFCGELMEFNHSLAVFLFSRFLLVGLFSFLVQKKKNICLLFFGDGRKNKEKRSNSIRKQTWFSWRTNGTQSFIGWFSFLSFSIGWTVFIPGPKKRKQLLQKKVFKRKQISL
jgi:cbb3-type cytochrome oxidase subunit 3